VIAPPARTEKGYRLYSPEAVDRLRFIRQAQGLGLTLGEIREIVTIRRGGRLPCPHVRRLFEAKAAELDGTLRDLLMLRRRIRQSLAAWGQRRGRLAAVCPHIESSPTPAPGRAPGRSTAEKAQRRRGPTRKAGGAAT
jgi:DNA-binding transcriptional MerR regulator